DLLREFHQPGKGQAVLPEVLRPLSTRQHDDGTSSSSQVCTDYRTQRACAQHGELKFTHRRVYTHALKFTFPRQLSCKASLPQQGSACPASSTARRGRNRTRRIWLQRRSGRDSAGSIPPASRNIIRRPASARGSLGFQIWRVVSSICRRSSRRSRAMI